MTPAGNFPKREYISVRHRWVSVQRRTGMCRYWFLITDVGDFVRILCLIDVSWIVRGWTSALFSSHPPTSCLPSQTPKVGFISCFHDFLKKNVTSQAPEHSSRRSEGVVAMITSKIKWRALTVMGLQTSDGLSASANSRFQLRLKI